MMEKSLVQLTHTQIMRMLPAGTGYLVAEDGMPCNWSLSLAMIIQATAFMQNPAHVRIEYIN